MFYINQNISCKKIENFQLTSSIEILTLEINLGKEKLLNLCTYKPPNINNSSFLNEQYTMQLLSIAICTKIVFCLVI